MIQELVPCFKKIWSISKKLLAFLKQTPLGNVVEDLGKLNKGLVIEDHVVIMEGPGK
jgi:hypothetical protein